MGPPVCPILDFHTHVNGTQAAEVWREAADAFGVGRALTMVRRLDAAPLSRLLGDRLSFIAFPDFRNEDRGKAMREGFLDDIRAFHDEHGAKIIKLWNAPRLREFFPDATGLDLIEFDGIWRVKQVELAQKLGMSVMVHVADPDTWFATRYSDPAKFGRKLDHYRGLEAMLTRFADVTWFAAHMGGYPERLDILDGLLERHPNLHIDTSATKWVLRELSNHPLPQLTAFFERWAGRILFGSDIVTTDEHMAPKASSSTHPMADLADSPQSAFDLYASRYFSLRLLFESDYQDESPIADPDLAMVDPTKYGPMDAPLLRGSRFSPAMLRTIYSGAAAGLKIQ